VCVTQVCDDIEENDEKMCDIVIVLCDWLCESDDVWEENMMMMIVYYYDYCVDIIIIRNDDDIKWNEWLICY
jgi:hypothetical protein